MKKRSTKPGSKRKNQPSSSQAVLDAPKPRRKATFKIEALEPRILLSATWVDSDTSESHSDATAGNDTYHGTTGGDVADGGAGHDTLHGDAGDDTLSGASGNDVLDGGDGNDILHGGDGTDTADYSSATSGVTVDLGHSGSQNTGGAGTDTLDGIENVSGSSHNDHLSGDSGANVLDGGAGHDRLTGDAGNDTLHGGTGDDVLKGGSGNDTLYGDAGHDTLRGGSGSDTLYGGEGHDSLRGGTGDDVLHGDAGNDSLKGDAGNDTLDGGDGNDTLKGGSGADTLLGGAGNDVLKGESGNDTLDGGAGDDTLRGGSGDDHLHASAGNDDMYGGSGDDTFHFDHATAGSTYHVYGRSGSDTIDLSTYSADRVHQSDGHIDVTTADGGSFTIHHSGVEHINVGGAASASLTSTTDTDDSDSDEGAFAVSAGSDATVASGSHAITLDAQVESGGDDMTVHWTQTGGPTVELSNADGAHPTFDAPDVTTPTELHFHVDVVDGSSTVSDDVVITLAPAGAGLTNHGPTADDGTITIHDDAGATALTLHGSDPDLGDSIDHYQIDSLADHGTLTLNGNAVHVGDTVTQAQIDHGDLQFTADAGFHGSTSFAFHAHDGDDLSANAGTMHIDVDYANHAPTTVDSSATFNQDTGGVIHLSGTDADSGDAVDHYVIDAAPDHGSLLLNGNAVHAGDSVSQTDIDAGHLTFTPDANWHGDTSFSFHAHDGDALSASAGNFAIHVDAATPAPAASATVFPSVSSPDAASSPLRPEAPIEVDVHGDTVEPHGPDLSMPSDSHHVDSSTDHHTDQPTSEVPTHAGNGAHSTVISDQPGAVEHDASAGNETHSPTVTESTPSAPHASSHTPPTWNGSENLGVLDPREGLHGFIPHSPGLADATHVEHAPVEFDAAHDSGLRPIHEFVLSPSTHAPTHDVGVSTIPANARFEDVFAEAGSTAGSMSSQAFVSDGDGSGSYLHRSVDSDVAGAAVHSGTADTNDHSLASSSLHSAADGTRAGTEVSSTSYEVDAVPLADGFFARLWAALRGLGPTQERDDAAANSNRHRP